jgi:hypothetical protein
MCVIAQTPQQQNPAQLRDAQVVIEHAIDVHEPDTEITKGHDTVQPTELLRVVPAVSATRIDPNRAEQTDLVVVAQRTD